MARPAILAVDDDQQVRNAVVRDLRAHYAKTYQIVAADSGRAALEITASLKKRNQPIALFLVDQRMPQMTGADFLAEAGEIFPDAKRVLLTAYADKDVAIQAINDIQLDYYLMKPWEPPDKLLYPALDELLSEWQVNYRPPFEGVTVIDHRWSKLGTEIRDFLARNNIPYRRLDVQVDDEAATLLKIAGDTAELPTVILPDGASLIQPTIAALANACGQSTRSKTPFYDLVVVGGGPAGLAAAVYGASEGLQTLVVECEAPGGQAGTSSRIENYLGFPKGLSGSELSRRALAQAERLGAEFLIARQVTGLRLDGPIKYVRLSDGSEISCHGLIIASGVQYRRLDVPGVTPLEGAGVFYGAATTEGAACKDQDVYVIGGGNSAGQGAIFLAEYARSVTILIRREDLSQTMSQYLIERIDQTDNISVLPHTQVIEVFGETVLESIKLQNTVTKAEEVRPASGLFVFIGAVAQTGWLDDQVARDDQDYILTGRDSQRLPNWRSTWPAERDPFLTETSVPGIFAAGDIRHGSVKRVAAAVGEGSITVRFVHQHLATL